MLKKKQAWIVLVLGVGLLLPSTEALARPAHDRRPDDHRGRREEVRAPRRPAYPYGRVVWSLPGGFINVVFGGGRYFYSGGVFYREHGPRYVAVAPPVGAVVYALPAGCQYRMIEGISYYTYQDVYYRPLNRGFQVVAPPHVPIAMAPAVAAPMDRTAYTVYIPDGAGGYAPVLLSKEGNGFVGPQGEFYPDFPRVDQLQVMYGRQAD